VSTNKYNFSASDNPTPQDRLRNFTDRLATHGCSPREQRNGQQAAFCPACRYRKHRTLSFAIGEKGHVVFQCWRKRGCDKEAVLRSIGLDWPDVCDRGNLKLDDDELMDDYRAGQLSPVPAGIADRVPTDAPAVDHRVAKHMDLRRGLRLARGEHPQRKFIYPMCKNAKELGISSATMSESLERIRDEYGGCHIAGRKAIVLRAADFSRRGPVRTRPARKREDAFQYLEGPTPTRQSRPPKAVANNRRAATAGSKSSVVSTNHAQGYLVEGGSTGRLFTDRAQSGVSMYDEELQIRWRERQRLATVGDLENPF
jgi:hypothetical protein